MELRNRVASIPGLLHHQFLIAYCKRSKTGGVEGLGTRLGTKGVGFLLHNDTILLQILFSVRLNTLHGLGYSKHSNSQRLLVRLSTLLRLIVCRAQGLYISNTVQT